MTVWTDMGERCNGSDNKRKQYFLQHKEKHINMKETYTDESKSTGRKVGFAAVFTDITRRGSLPEEASIHKAEMTAIKIAMKEIREREERRWVLYILSELNASYREQQRKSPNIKPDI